MLLVIRAILFFFLVQIRGRSADPWSGCDRRDVQLGDHLLQRHCRLHGAQRGKHAARSQYKTSHHFLKSKRAF